MIILVHLHLNRVDEFAVTFYGIVFRGESGVKTVFRHFDDGPYSACCRGSVSVLHVVLIGLEQLACFSDRGTMRFVFQLFGDGLIQVA